MNVARSILLHIVLLFSVGTASVQTTDRDDTPLYLQNRNYPLQTGLYDLYRTRQADVVMLGNSITFGVNWNELLGRTSIANRGIPSDITDGILHRLDYVYKLHPRLCFVMAGINDLYADVGLDSVFQNYRAIIDQLLAHQIQPIIQSTLYVSTKWKRYKAKNLQVEHLNRLLQALADDRNVPFIDLNALMSNGRLLREEFTYDGVHLNASGYALWGAEVEKILQHNGL